MGDDLTATFSRAISSRDTDKENTLLLGQASGSIAGHQERAPAASNKQAQETKTRKNKDNTSRFIQLTEDLRADMARWSAEIEAMEMQFRQRDGDAWREKLALKILSENDIPQRRDGELMKDYRDRLETHLINELLNEDGTIKDEYKHYPELADYSEWAQKQYHFNNAAVLLAELEDPDTTPAHQQVLLEELKQRADIEEQVFADRQAASQSEVQGQIKDGTDTNHDSTLHKDHSSASAMFLDPKL